LLMAAAEVDAKGQLTLSSNPSEPRFEMPGSGLYATISDRDGRAVWRSRSALASAPPAASGLPAGSQSFEEVRAADGHSYFLQSFGVSWATQGGSYPFTISSTSIAATCGGGSVRWACCCSRRRR